MNNLKPEIGATYAMQYDPSLDMLTELVERITVLGTPNVSAGLPFFKTVVPGVAYATSKMGPNHPRWMTLEEFNDRALYRIE